MNIILQGTKEKIFDSAIELFSSLGYENVSIGDIAGRAGISEGAIYHYFKGKHHILDLIYDYFLEHYHDNMTPVDEVKELLETLTSRGFMEAVSYTFESEDKNKYKRMVLTVKIVYMRAFYDKRARHIFNWVLGLSEVNYLREILEYGVRIGRLPQSFDIPIYAHIAVDSRTIMGIKAFSDPEYSVNQLDEEERILKLLAEMLPLDHTEHTGNTKNERTGDTKK